MECLYCNGTLKVIEDMGTSYWVKCDSSKCGIEMNVSKDEYAEKTLKQ